MIVRTPNELGHLVREQRLHRGWTQAEMAAQVGVSRKWVIDLESGKRTTDLSLVMRTLNALGIELDARERRQSPSTAAGVDLDEIINAARKRRP